MHPVEKVLGFRVNQMRDQVETLDKNGVVTNVRPATTHESALWSEVMENYAARQASAQASADLKSVVAANEAYREQLQKLHDFLAHKYPIMPTDDCIEYAMNRLVGLEHRKNELRKKILEIWQMPPGVDVFDFMLERLKDVTGENMEATEKRRADTIKERAERFPGDPMNSMLADELDKVHVRIVGKKVQE